MQIIWEHGGSILVSELLETILVKNKNWKRTTVQTFLSRMVEKNYLTYKKNGRNSEYSALISEEEYIVQQTEVFVQKMYKGSPKNLVSALLKHDSLTTKDIDELKDFWNRKE